MIQFEITEGPDENVLSTFKYFHNELHLGRSIGDLWINDPELSASHVMLEVIGSELLVHPQKGVEFYLLNGKRSTTIRKLKLNDSIQIGLTKIKIMAFEESARESKKNILNSKLQKLIENNSPRLTVVENLTRMMK